MLPPIIPTACYASAPIFVAQDAPMELPALPQGFQGVLQENVPAVILNEVGGQTTFAAALDVIARYKRIAILVEGNPHNPPRGSIAERVRELQKEGKPVSFGRLTANLAALYDYQFSEKSGVLILEKRYTLPDDFPELPTEEMAYFFRSVVQLTRSANPDFPRQEGIDVRFRDFWSSLAPTQLALWTPQEATPLPVNPSLERIRAMSGRHGSDSRERIDTEPGIPMAALTPVQQGFVRDLALKNVVGKDADNIAMATQILRDIDTKATKFFYKEFAGQNCFFSEHPGPKRVISTPMAPVARVVMNFDGGMVAYKPMDGSDVSEPKAQDYDKDGKPLPRPFEITTYSKTLRQFADEATQTSGLTVTVYPALEKKTVNLVNAGAVPVPKVAEAIGALFNLPVVERDKEVHINPQTAPGGLTLSETPRAIERIMPGPIKRLYGGLLQAGYTRQLEQFKIPYADRSRLARNPVVEAASGREAMRRAAIRRLRVLLDPQIKASKGGAVYWNEISDEAKWLFSFIVTCEAIPMTVRQATMGLPDFITHPEDCVVVGTVAEDQGRRWLKIGVRTPNGQGFADVGVIEKISKAP